MDPRRLCALALCALLLFTMAVGCARKNNTASSEISSSSQEETGSSEVSSSEVSSSPESSALPAGGSSLSSPPSSGEDVVAVTIPADFFGSNLTLEQLMETARQLGMNNYRTNDDGSVTFYMTESMRQTVTDTFADALRMYAAGLAGNDAWPAVTKCELNDSLDQVTLYVDEELYSPQREDTIAKALYIPLSLYQLFMEGSTEGFTLQCTVKAQADGHTLSMFTYPEE